MIGFCDKIANLLSITARVRYNHPRQLPTGLRLVARIFHTRCSGAGAVTAAFHPDSLSFG